MPQSRDYWQERFIMLHEAMLNKGEEYMQGLDKIYRQTAAEVEKDLAAWYNRFAENNEITLLEAKRLLRSNELDELRWTVEEYIKAGLENAVDQRWMRELENASSRVHITRLESIQLQLRHHIESLFGQQLQGVKNLASDIYTDDYYHTAYEIQKGFNVGYDFMALDATRINQVISKPWAADGKTFSDRIWTSKNELINTVHTQLTQAIIRGESPAGVIKQISQKFNVSRFKAGRLVMTESAFFASAAQNDCFKELGVEKYEYVATLDKKTSEICQQMDGQVFSMKDFKVGTTAPPLHVWCRSVTVPWFADDFGERVATNHEGSTVYIPSDMTYKEWYNSVITPSKLSDKKWLKAEFQTKKKLDRHLKDHLGDYPGFTEQDYINRARELLASNLSDNINGFVGKDGFIFKYDKSNNDFAIGHYGGSISTLYKPDGKYDYWLEQTRLFKE